MTWKSPCYGRSSNYWLAGQHQGGDLSDGQVKTYRFVYSQKIEELLSPSVNALAFVGFKWEDSPGQRVRHVINFKYYSQGYYVGLFAFDKFGHMGNMSNLVLVNVPIGKIHPFSKIAVTLEPVMQF